MRSEAEQHSRQTHGMREPPGPWECCCPQHSPTPVVLARGWEGGLPQVHGEEGPRRRSAPSQLSTATLCPSTSDSDPSHTQPSPAFKLKLRQFV